VLASMGMSHRLKGAWGCIDPPSGAARPQAVPVVVRYNEGSGSASHATRAAKVEVAAGQVADLDRWWGSGERQTPTLSAMKGQRMARAGLAGDREQAAGTLASLNAKRAFLAAQSRRIETEAAPIRYVAELVRADTDSERAIRLLILMTVLCRDPLALTAAAFARGATQ
jgi:hypothetical protein